MIKLKINKVILETLCNFSNYTFQQVEIEIKSFLFKPKTLELIQLHVQREELKILKRKLEVLSLKKMDAEKNKKFSLTLSPIQSLLILAYNERYKQNTNEPYSVFILNEQKDIIYKELLTK